MTFSDIALDEFASGPKWESTIYATLIIVSICLLLSVILFITRLYQVIQENMEQDNRSIAIRLFQVTHLLAMFSSCFYLFLYEWNYSHWFTKTNVMDCGIWYELIMLSITMSKVFIYTFLMLRTTLSFSSSFFRIPLKLSIPVIILSCTSQLTMMGLMLYDYTPISPFPFNGFCFRILGEHGVAGIAGFNFSDALSGFVAIVIFWWKSREVTAWFGSMENEKQIDKELMNLKEVFRKHIFFGMFIFMGPMLIFFAGEFLTVLMGVASALHQLMNNIYIFLLFKQNIPIYNRLCCRVKVVPDEVQLAAIQIHHKSNDNDNNNNDNTDNTKPMDDTEGNYKWKEFNPMNTTIFGAHIEKRGSLRSQSSFEIAPYKPYNNMMITSRKKSSSYTDLKKLDTKQGVASNANIKIMDSLQHRLCDNQSMSTPMVGTPNHLTPMFDGDTGGRIKLMDVPTQSSMADVSHTVPAYQLCDA